MTTEDGSIPTEKVLEGSLPDLMDRLKTDPASAGEDAGSGLVGYSTAATDTHGLLGRQASASAFCGASLLLLQASRPTQALLWHCVAVQTKSESTEPEVRATRNSVDGKSVSGVRLWCIASTFPSTQANL